MDEDEELMKDFVRDEEFESQIKDRHETKNKKSRKR